MTYFTVKDVTLTLDKSAQVITIGVGPHAVTMRIGEWSKLISRPLTSARILVVSDEGEIDPDA